MSPEWTGALIALGGVAVAAVALWLNRRSTAAAERAEQWAKASAEQAAKVVAIEEERRHEERERRHEELGPPQPAHIAVRVESSRAGGKHVFGTVTVPRDYRVHAEALQGNATMRLALPLVLRANQPQRFAVEQLAPGVKKPQVEKIRFQFWPPIAELDKTTDWACPCGRPTHEGSEPAGHWEWLVPIENKTPPVPMVA